MSIILYDYQIDFIKKLRQQFEKNEIEIYIDKNGSFKYYIQEDDGFDVDIKKNINKIMIHTHPISFYTIDFPSSKTKYSPPSWKDINICILYGLSKEYVIFDKTGIWIYSLNNHLIDIIDTDNKYKEFKQMKIVLLDEVGRLSYNLVVNLITLTEYIKQMKRIVKTSDKNKYFGVSVRFIKYTDIKKKIKLKI